jgi:hypothetical protein
MPDKLTPTQQRLRDARYIRKVNAETIRVADLRAVVAEAADPSKTRRSFESLVGLIRETLPKASAAYRVAVMFRLEALAHLVEAGDVPGFTQKGGQAGLSLISDAVIAAAARCTLHPGGENRVLFDRAEFSTEALRAADVEGTG